MSFTDRFGKIPCSVDNIRSCSSLKEAQKFSKKIPPTFDGVRDLDSHMSNWATFNVVIRIVRGNKSCLVRIRVVMLIEVRVSFRF